MGSSKYSTCLLWPACVVPSCSPALPSLGVLLFMVIMTQPLERLLKGAKGLHCTRVA